MREFDFQNQSIRFDSIEGESKLGGYDIAFFSGSSLTKNMLLLSQITAEVATDGFGPKKAMGPELMERRLKKEGNLLIILEEQDPIGFQMQTVFGAEGEEFLYYSRVVRKNFQGRGIGKKLLGMAVEIHKPTLISARSQNPAEMLSFIHLAKQIGCIQIFPFDNDYSASDRALKALSILTKELGCSDNTNQQTGVCNQAYKEGRLGDYEVRTNDPDTFALETRLSDLGLDRENGDAIFYLGFLKEKRS